jgi:hypothetical protein
MSNFLINVQLACRRPNQNAAFLNQSSEQLSDTKGMAQKGSHTQIALSAIQCFRPRVI